MRCKIINDTIGVDDEIEQGATENTHRIINIKKIETMINEKLCCLCHVTDTVDNFVEYCCEIDNMFERRK